MILVTSKDVVVEDKDIALVAQVVASVGKNDRSNFVAGTKLSDRLVALRAQIEKHPAKDVIFKLLTEDAVEVIQFGKIGYDITESAEDQIKKLKAIKTALGKFLKVESFEFALDKSILDVPKDGKIWVKKVDFEGKFPKLTLLKGTASNKVKPAKVVIPLDLGEFGSLDDFDEETTAKVETPAAAKAETEKFDEDSFDFD